MKMNTSFELLSSMSPKLNKHQKLIRRPPTKLALKSYFRKSLTLEHSTNNAQDISVITVESGSTDSSSLKDEKLLNETPIIISDSETSFAKNGTPKKFFESKDNITPKTNNRSLSDEKYLKIQNWVNEVNNAEQDFSTFGEVSAIVGEKDVGFKCPDTDIAASSTLLESAIKRFDEFFQRKSPGKANKSEFESTKEQRSYGALEENRDNLFINDSLENNSDLEDKKNINIDDSFQLDLDDSLSTRIRNNRKSNEPKSVVDVVIDDSFENPTNLVNKQNEQGLFKLNVSSKSSECISDDKDDIGAENEYEDLLDSLYGNSWREKKDLILPSTEPRLKKSSDIIQPKVPNTERHALKWPECNVNDNNLLRTLQRANFKKALESPWMSSVKKICDTDTESENEDKSNNLPHIRLNFDDDNSNDIENNFRKPHSDKLIKKSTKNQKKKKDPPLENNKNQSKTLSFLASLSSITPVEKCDMSALIFRNSFQQHKETLAVKLFNLFNEKVFNNAIPKNTVIEWNERMRGTAGLCKCKKITRRTGIVERTVQITLATKVLDSADRLRDTLIHELCHAATWIVNEVSDGHGHFWKSWARHAIKTFPELPPIQRCHNYVINTKYTYRCTGCGYSIGRHTKSLDTQRKRCGYCMGTFEVLINKTSKKGETRSVPVTPKQPTGFALFVKENYGKCKTPDLKHGDVMKILGQKFSGLKLNKS